MSTTRLGLTGTPWRPYGFWVAKSEQTVTPSYIFTAIARSTTDTASARSMTHTATARSMTDTADAANRMNQ